MRELLLCPPDYYGIEYEINPWMSTRALPTPRLFKRNGKPRRFQACIPEFI
jgi:hypothetical protein